MFHEVIDLPVANKNNISEVNEVNNNIQSVEELDLGDDVKKIEGVIKGETEKALLLQMNNNNELWFPKSTIKSIYKSNMGSKQSFIINTWILEK